MIQLELYLRDIARRHHADHAPPVLEEHREHAPLLGRPEEPSATLAARPAMRGGGHPVRVGERLFDLLRCNAVFVDVTDVLVIPIEVDGLHEVSTVDTGYTAEACRRRWERSWRCYHWGVRGAAIAGRSVTVELPEDLYERLRRRAAAQRSLDDEVAQVLVEVMPAGEDRLPPTLQQELLHVEGLTDVALWKLARARLSTRTAMRMQSLQFKRQREGLSDDERRLEAALADEYDRHMQIRSKALLLL
jgi:plasmid stability protein